MIESNMIYSLSFNQISLKGVSYLFETLKEYNVQLSDIILFNNQLNSECMKPIGKYMENNNSIHELNLGSNKNIKDDGIEILSEYIIGNSTLKDMSFYLCKGITEQSMNNLIEIAKSTCITHMSIYDTCISAEKATELSQYLSVPIDEREIAIKSTSKSAAKITT